MKVQPLSVGPILGATGPDSARIFGRGEFQLDRGQPRRSHAVVRFRKRDSGDYGDPKYGKLNPNFDMTAVTVLEGLSADTVYEYQAGAIFSDVGSGDIDVSAVLDWSDIETHRFRTGTTKKAEPRTLVVGSCRYLLRLFGGNWFDDRGDKTFRSIRRKHGNQGSIDSLIMVGDQIYADDLNFLKPDDAIAEYLSRYRAVFSQKHIRALMACVPTYMTLDDHEIEDNWPAQASIKDYVTKFPAAVHAYQTYQLSHSPLHPVVNGHIDAAPDRMWYSHRDGCCDFFFTDTRTERYLGNGTQEIVSEAQMDALLAWLGDGSGRVKVIATAVPFWESTSDDKWNGFLAQRDRILEHIRTNKVKRVLMLSGDVHASMSSELQLKDDPDFRIVSVVSSAFFWPYPHPLKRSFHLKGGIATQTDRSYRVKNASSVYPTDNFTRLKIDPDRVRVEVFSRKGDRLGSRTHSFV